MQVYARNSDSDDWIVLVDRSESGIGSPTEEVISMLSLVFFGFTVSRVISAGSALVKMFCRPQFFVLLKSFFSTADHVARQYSRVFAVRGRGMC